MVFEKAAHQGLTAHTRQQCSVPVLALGAAVLFAPHLLLRLKLGLIPGDPLPVVLIVHCATQRRGSALDVGLPNHVGTWKRCHIMLECGLSQPTVPALLRQNV